ncbi:putative Zinc finger C2H2-type [Septoria linicola]|nr:putative Zinc finger C2H2-type [Septoria linicola]
MNTRTNYEYNPSPSIFNKLAGLFDKALDLESVIEHPSPYPRIARRKSYRQLRDSYSPNNTMSDSKYYSTRLIAPNGYGAVPSPSSSYGSSYYGSPSSAYQAYGSPSSPYQPYNNPVSYSAPPASTPPTVEYCCLMSGCNYAAKRNADLERHYKSMHSAPSSIEMFDCQVSGCHRTGNYGFKRRDKMVDHMREVHKVDVPKKNISSRTTSRRPSETVVTARVVYPDEYADRYYYSR